MSAFTADVARALNGPSWLTERRVAAFEKWDGSAPPTAAEEIWRYSRVDAFDLGQYQPATSEGAFGSDSGVPVSIDPLMAQLGERAGVVIVRNGRVVLAQVDDSLAAKGVVVGDLAATGANGDASARDSLGRCSRDTADWFVDLHDAFLFGGAFIQVPPGVVIDRPIFVFHVAEGDGIASFPHTLVVAGENSEVTVLEHHSSTDVAHLSNAVVELSVGNAARVDYVSLQDHGPRVWQVALQRAHLGRDATLRSAVLALGGDYARTRTESLLAGEGATSEMVAVYFANESQMLDFRTLQDHAAPRTGSDLLFKGAVEDEARSVYSGLIRLRPEAQRAHASQTNRNLVLSPGAGAESIPNLEIEANDVRCSHASAVGPIDEDQLYYLQSRGVPPDVAERMIVFGFFEDVVERLPVPALAARLRATVTEKFLARDYRAGDYRAGDYRATA